MSKEVHTYFRKRPRVALLDVYAIESIISPFLNPKSLQVILSPVASRQLAALNLWVSQAELELLEVCTANDLGLSLLTAEPEYVNELIARCYATGFPLGLQAQHEMLHIGETVAELPHAALSVQNIHMQAIVLLRHLARGQTINRLDHLRSDELWTQDDWDEYFAAFPNCEFRIPVGTAATAVYKRDPSLLTDAAARLFARHFSSKQPKSFATQKWDEAIRQSRDEDPYGYV